VLIEGSRCEREDRPWNVKRFNRLGDTIAARVKQP